MKLPLALLFSACLIASPLLAQDSSWRTSNPPRGQSVQPRSSGLQGGTPQRQPVNRVPGMHANGSQPRTQPSATQPRAMVQARAPFQLTPQEQAQIDSILTKWERETQGIKTFECEFYKLKYDPVFGPKDKPRSVDKGTIKYAMPNQGLYEIGGDVPEKWCTDGESFYQYKFGEKQVVEHVLGPEAKGTGFAQCPIPFIFGAKAKDIKRRYWLRLNPPAGADPAKEIWIETYPKTQADAANYRRVDVILDARSMHPMAIQVYLPGDPRAPGGGQRDVYNFGRPLVNDPLRVFKRGAFSGPVPLGWKKVREQQTASGPRTRR